MNEETWFGYPIWYTSALYPRNNDLVKYCVLKKLEEESAAKSNVGGWQSGNLYAQSDFLFSDFYDHIKKHITPLEELTGVKYKIGNSWINVNSYENYNTPHTHPNSFLSGVYYVKADKTQGNISFINPYLNWNKFLFQDIKYFKKYVNDVEYTPETGKLIIFPSFLPHFVKPNPKSADRISIAFNMNLV